MRSYHYNTHTPRFLQTCVPLTISTISTGHAITEMPHISDLAHLFPCALCLRLHVFTDAIEKPIHSALARACVSAQQLSAYHFEMINLTPRRVNFCASYVDNARGLTVMVRPGAFM